MNLHIRPYLLQVGNECIDLGIDVSVDQFLQAVQEHNAQVLCCYALLKTTMNEMKAVVAKEKELSIREKRFIMVSGTPITQEYYDSIGADCYT